MTLKVHLSLRAGAEFGDSTLIRPETFNLKRPADQVQLPGDGVWLDGQAVEWKHVREVTIKPVEE